MVPGILPSLLGSLSMGRTYIEILMILQSVDIGTPLIPSWFGLVRYLLLPYLGTWLLCAKARGQQRRCASSVQVVPH